MGRMKLLVPVLGLLSFVLLSESKVQNEVRHSVRKFPPGFAFGTSTAAYQIEGGWNADGKGENIWDRYTHDNKCITDDCQNGDIANDSYNLYKRDVEMMRELGLDYYRFSISWARILPTSFPDKINEAGVQYYNNLINEMLKYNIKPLVTMYHWDLPQKLQEMGGFANPHIVDWFADYARVLYQLFGDRVKEWITLNEPAQICHHSLGDTGLAPGLNITGVAEYLCVKNLLLAHAKAYHIYDKEFRQTQGGTVGIAISVMWYEPETDYDIEAAEIANQFNWGVFAHPIYSANGDYPQKMKQRIAEKSAAQGFKRSRLPDFTPEEVKYVQGSADFFGLNHYTAYLTYKNKKGLFEGPSYKDDIGATVYQPSHWTGSASSWLKDVPWGFYKILTFIRKEYNNPAVMITENGFSSKGGLEDDDRIAYIRGYIDAMLDAIEEGSNVTVYSPWSLMDNFEWRRGYTERFGFYEVDYASPQRTRTPRKSAFVLKEIVRSRAIDFHYEPDTTVMTIDEGH